MQVNLDDYKANPTADDIEDDYDDNFDDEDEILDDDGDDEVRSDDETMMVSGLRHLTFHLDTTNTLTSLSFH